MYTCFDLDCFPSATADSIGFSRRQPPRIRILVGDNLKVVKNERGFGSLTLIDYHLLQEMEYYSIVSRVPLVFEEPPITYKVSADIEIAEAFFLHSFMSAILFHFSGFGGILPNSVT